MFKNILIYVLFNGNISNILVRKYCFRNCWIKFYSSASESSMYTSNLHIRHVLLWQFRPGYNALETMSVKDKYNPNAFVETLAWMIHRGLGMFTENLLQTKVVKKHTVYYVVKLASQASQFNQNFLSSL